MLLLSLSAIGQASGHISLRPLIEGKSIDTIHGNLLEAGHCKIEKLSFYIYFEGKEDVQASEVALFQLSEGQWARSYSSYGSLKLGVDSNLNLLGVHKGDLDPVHGMYWSWQSGYIHFKLEGSWSGEGGLQPFVYHIGGFNTKGSGPYTLRKIEEINQATFALDLAPALNWAKARNIDRIMSPGEKANAFAAELVKGFSDL